MEKSGFQEKRHPGRTWIILNTFGWGAFLLIAGVIGLLALQASQNSPSANELLSDTSVNIIGTSIVGGLCWGVILGGLQKSFLIRHLNLPGMHWIFATILGLILYLAFQYQISMCRSSCLLFTPLKLKFFSILPFILFPRLHWV